MAAKVSREGVEAPVRAALGRIIVGGVVLFAAALLAGLCTRLCGVDHHWRPITHFGAAGVMLVYLVATAIHRRFARPVDPSLREQAWTRAWELDRADAQLASLLVAAVPVALLVALASMVLPHLGYPAHQAEEIGLWVPPLAMLWCFVTRRWLSQCRDQLARSIARSEEQLRVYWLSPGG